MKQKKIQIGIIGPEEKNISKVRRVRVLELAEKIGERVAQKKAVLITGGCSGVVEAACRGAYRAGGIVVGTPGSKRGTAIPWTTVEICTPIDIGDYIFAGILSSDVIIVVPSDAGTLGEIAIAFRNRKPLILIKGFDEDFLEVIKLEGLQSYPYYVVESAEEAVNLAIKLAMV